MADPLLEADIALGLTPTPTATPTPMMTPIAAPELSLLERMRQSSYAVPEPFRSLGSAGLSLFENPRVIPEEGASIAGSVIGSSAGAALGLPFAPVTGGLSVPAGSILGGALGSYADVPVQMGLDYLLGTTPKQSRVSQATEEAALGAAVEGGLRLLPPAYRLGSRLTSGLGNLYRGYVGPATEEAAQRLVGQELPGVISAPALQKAAQEKEILLSAGIPSEKLTVADITGSQQAAMAEELLSGQSLSSANVELKNLATGQIKDIDSAAKALTNIANPDPVKSGSAVQSLLEGAKESQRATASAKFDIPEVTSIPVATEGLSDAATASFSRWMGEAGKLGADAPPSKLNRIYKTILKLDDPEAKEPIQATVGTLQSLRSNLLEEARRLPDGSNDWAFALDLADGLDKRIDAVNGGKALSEARAAWKDYKQTWYRTEKKNIAPLAKVLKEEAPENVMQKISSNSAVSSAYAKVLGVQEPLKLANEMKSFVKLKTVDEKLKWIDDNRAIYSGTPLENTLAGWENVLQRVSKKQELGTVKGLSPENINFEASALIRALGGAGKEVTASAAEAATKQVAFNSARGMFTKAVPSLAAGLTGGLFGLATGGPVGALAGGSLLAGLEFARGKAVEKGTRLTAQALTEALSDPTTALNYIEQAVKGATTDTQRKKVAETLQQAFANQVEQISPQAAAIGRAAISDNPLQTSASTVAATPTMTQAEATKLDALAEAESLLEGFDINSLLEAPPAAEPTPQPEAVKVGKQNISIPTGDKYAEPSLVKAVMKVESAGKQEAVSPKGATGLMQLMPATAKALGVDATDAEQNVEGGSRYLQQMINKYGKTDIALAAYNWGPGNIDKAIKKLNAERKAVTWANIMQIVKVPMETRLYVNKVLKNREVEA